MAKVNVITGLLPATIKCSHCLVSFHIPAQSRVGSYLGAGTNGHWWLAFANCPSCNDIVIWLAVSDDVSHGAMQRSAPKGSTNLIMVYPKASGRPPVPTEVPPEFAEDYTEGLPCNQRQSQGQRSPKPQVSSAHSPKKGGCQEPQ